MKNNEIKYSLNTDSCGIIWIGDSATLSRNRQVVKGSITFVIRSISLQNENII